MTRGDPDTLDPSLSRTFDAVEVYKAMCERLYDYDLKVNLVPELAARLPKISKDKLTYTIPLRHGVRFNDGTPFTAQAVVATIERDLTIPRSSRAGDYLPVAAVKAPSRYTVVIRLKTPYTPMTKVLASADGVIMSPAQLTKLGENFGTDPICVGPFMFANRIAGDSITVVKSPYYYHRREVHLDKVVFRSEPEAQAAVAALEAGDLQALDSLPALDVPALERSKSLHVMRAKSLGFEAVFVNMGNTQGIGHLPYGTAGNVLASSPKLRQAFEEAIDRNALNKVVFGGHVMPGCTPVSPLAPEFQAYDANIHCTRFSPATAKTLVAASGIAGPTVHLLTSNQSDMLRLAQVIQVEEAAVGIKVVIDPTDTATANARTTAGTFEAYLGSWSGSPDTDRQFFQFLATQGSLNWCGYSNPRLDLILANARKATRGKSLATLYRAAQKIILADRPVIYLYHPVVYAAVDANVTGVQLPFDALLRVAFAQYR
jgi:peptide/nickel transport system substrate-binding protein